MTSAENRQQIAFEEKRKAMQDLKSLRLINENLESMIVSHEREKERLTCELKRFTKGKVRSNMLEAELHRLNKQNDIIKSANQVTQKLFAGVSAAKSVQTDIAGLKGHLLQLSEAQYQAKFNRETADAQV